MASAVYTSANELACAIRVWHSVGIDLYLLDRDGSHTSFVEPMTCPMSAGGLVLHVLDAIATLQTNSRSEAIIRGIADRKSKGLRHTRYAGHGFRWAGTPGRQRKVADDYEQQAIRKIIEWRDIGASWAGIAVHLLRHGITTESGQEWSPDRVRRAYLAWTASRSELTAP
jgi:DNA invertase Pin-like site-specific DNA recombinase